MNLAAVKLPPLSPGEFRFTTKALMPDAAPSGDGRRRFKTIASSTVVDQQGHEMKMSALEDMAAAFRKGVMIFMNHKYVVPEEVFGMSDAAEIRASGESDPKTGYPIYDLLIGGFVDETNPRAIQLHESISAGMRHGTSIGAIVKDHLRKKGGGVDILHVDLKEASIVGMPVNQRSWVQKAANAVASLEDAEAAGRFVGDDEDEVEDDLAKGGAVGNLPTDVVVGESGPETVEKAMCPSCGKGRDAEGCDDDYHGRTQKGAEALEGATTPTETPAEEPVTKGETADDATPDREAEGATPDHGQAAEGATPEPEPEEAVKAFDGEDVEELARKAVGLATLVSERDEEIVALKAERDKALADLGEATQVIEKLMRMPLRPQAQQHIAKAMHRLPDFIDPSVRSILENS